MNQAPGWQEEHWLVDMATDPLRREPQTF
ncbi:uncharacterized protein METZ01_LOCUS289212 [marine metagenome]|uniref:Uncharacterized protein n=1 Tax=marine metagenome TaxID=408172 RepID=A0A382LHW2_9ZZZZ